MNDNSGNGNNQTISNPGTHTGSGNMTFNSNTTITFTGLNATKAWCVIYAAMVAEENKERLKDEQIRLKDLEIQRVKDQEMQQFRDELVEEQRKKDDLN